MNFCEETPLKMEEREWIPLLGQLSPVKGDFDSSLMNLDENLKCSELDSLML